MFILNDFMVSVVFIYNTFSPLPSYPFRPLVQLYVKHGKIKFLQLVIRVLSFCVATYTWYMLLEFAVCFGKKKHVIVTKRFDGIIRVVFLVYWSILFKVLCSALGAVVCILCWKI